MEDSFRQEVRSGSVVETNEGLMNSKELGEAEKMCLDLLSSKGKELVCVDCDDLILETEPLAIDAHNGGEEDIPTSFETSEWVLGIVSSFRHLVGLSCEGHEE